MKGKTQLIVALDVATLDEAKGLVDILKEKVKLFKVGSQLFTAYGPEAVKMVGEKGAKVFLDLKFHDIPNTVYSASSSASSICINPALVYYVAGSSLVENVKKTMESGVFMMTVHTKGGIEMLKAAVKGAEDKAKELRIERPLIVGVTRLTSDKNSENTLAEVLQAGRLAQEGGLDGVVCSAAEAAAVREKFPDFVIVVPGIRPPGYKLDDQSRVATVKEAVKSGADYIVVGRPIIKAKDPLQVVGEILEEIR